jgi:WD40 repeat protein
MKVPIRLIVVCCSLISALGGLSLSAPVPKPPPPKERAILKGHKGDIYSICFSPDGKSLASASADETIQLWEVATAKNTATLSAHSGSVRALAFSPKGKILASRGPEDPLHLWDVPRGREIAAFRLPWGYSKTLLFSRDGKTVFNGFFWDISAKKPREDIKGSFPNDRRVDLQSAAYNADGKLLGVVWSRSARTGEIWDFLANKAERTLEVPEDSVVGQCAAFNPEGKVFASAAQWLCLWDVRTGKLIGNSKRPGDLTTALAFSPDGKLLAAAWRRTPRQAGPYPGVISLLDAATGKELASLEGHTYPIMCLAFSPDGKLLASSGSGDWLIKLWDVRGVKAPKKKDSRNRVYLSIVDHPAADAAGSPLRGEPAASAAGWSTIDRNTSDSDRATKKPLASRRSTPHNNS